MPSSTEPRFVYGVTPFTQLDYPGTLACIVWLAGCNLRCAYCHNPEMVAGKGRHLWSTVVEFLRMRQGKLQGVVFSGGEATSCPRLPEMCRQAKDLGYKVKLDTNGTRPGMVGQLLNAGLVDYIALDYKAPPAKFGAVTGVKDSLWQAFSQTLDLLVLQQKVPFEVRTTVHTGLLAEEDIAQIQRDLDRRGYAGTYYLQNYRHGATLGNLAPQEIPLAQGHFQANQRVAIDYRNF